MSIALRPWRRVLVLVAAVGMLVAVSSAQAQEGTGAEANKDCPGISASPGDTVVCNFSIENTGDLPAVITTLTETSPDPGGAPVNISCAAGGVTYDDGRHAAERRGVLGDVHAHRSERPRAVRHGHS